jgi:acetyltransferase-like isoleucine patch superfamily enzyme
MSKLPMSLEASLRRLVQETKQVWRWISYSVRFYGLNIQIHPTTWVAPDAIIRCTGGGKIVIGRHCEIHNFSMIDSCGGAVDIGSFCSLNPFAIIYGHGGTKIGNYVRIAAHSIVIPANHDYRSEKHLNESLVTGVGIEIDNDVWLGSGARILDGVKIGSRSVVAAGAVVTRSIPSGCLAMGVPARSVVIKQ